MTIRFKCTLCGHLKHRPGRCFKCDRLPSFVGPDERGKLIREGKARRKELK